MATTIRQQLAEQAGQIRQLREQLDDLFSTADDPPQVPVWVRICNHPRCVLTVAHKHGVR